MTWRKILTNLLRLLLIAAFVPVLLDILIVFPALAAKALSVPGLPTPTIVFMAGPPVAGFIALAVTAWLSLRLWHSQRWCAVGFLAALSAFAAVWTAAIL
jgi:hypothetical protein